MKLSLFIGQLSICIVLIRSCDWIPSTFLTRTSGLVISFALTFAPDLWVYLCSLKKNHAAEWRERGLTTPAKTHTWREQASSPIPEEKFAKKSKPLDQNHSKQVSDRER